METLGNLAPFLAMGLSLVSIVGSSLMYWGTGQRTKLWLSLAVVAVLVSIVGGLMNGVWQDIYLSLT